MSAAGSRFLTVPPLQMDADSILRSFAHYFLHTLGRRVLSSESPFVYRALAHVIRNLEP